VTGLRGPSQRAALVSDHDASSGNSLAPGPPPRLGSLKWAGILAESEDAHSFADAEVPETTLQATQRQIDGFVNQLSFKCYFPGIDVGD